MALAKIETNPRVVLNLSAEEAIAIALVMNRVGGNPETTPRRHIDTIRKAISEVLGVYHFSSEDFFEEDSGIYFSSGRLDKFAKVVDENF